MEKELRLLLPLLEDGREVDGFHVGKIEGRDVVVAKSGIGKVNAALLASRLIDRFHPDIVINSGVAGGTGSGASVMDVVVGLRVAYHDVWCGPGTEWGEAAGCPLFFESAPEVTSLPCLHGDSAIKHGLVCSGDIFVSDPEVIASIRRRFPDVLAVDMESAAIAQTCYLKGVKFACLRVVSDTPGEASDNAAQYENFWETAPELTFQILRSVISSI